MAFMLPPYACCAPCEEESDDSTAVQYLYGNGSPEGVVTAPPGATYVDVDAPALYFKYSGEGNTGWA